MGRKLANLPSLKKILKPANKDSLPAETNTYTTAVGTATGESTNSPVHHDGGHVDGQRLAISSVPFKHQPLDSTCHSIRVFRIHPGVGPVSCEIKHVATSFTYTAISYVCGLPTPTDTIAINGQWYEVRQSLHRILILLRRQLKFSEYFWADAICINESEVEERNVQVGYMGEIYSRAHRTLSCISTDNDRCEDFLKVALDLHKTSRKAPYSNAPNPHRAVVKTRATLTDEHKTILKDFCRAEYFSRTWICQEVILPTGLHVALCGSTSMEWRALRSILTVMIKELPYDTTGSLRNSGIASLSQHLATVYSESVFGHGPEALATLIKRFAGFKCYDPRDHIYALGSLWYSKDSPIQPDYGKSCAALFWDLMFYLKSDEDLLCRLLQVTTSELRDALPAVSRGSSTFVIKGGNSSEAAPYLWSEFFPLHFNRLGSGIATYDQHLPERQVEVCFCSCERCARINLTDATEHSIQFTGLSNGRLMVRVSTLPRASQTPLKKMVIGFASASRYRTALGGSSLQYCVVLPLQLNGDDAHVDFSQGIRVSEAGLLEYMDVRDFESALDSGRSLNHHTFPTE